jgi:membrane protease YdiL (CAAX protease family)
VAPWVPYLALVIFPLVIFVPFNPLRFRWGYQHGFEQIPQELQEKFERVDRCITYPFRAALLIALIVAFTYHSRIPAIRLGLSWDHWRANATIGVCAGLLRFVFLGLAWRFIPLRKDVLANSSHDHVRGPVLTWVLLFLLSVFSEELWWALCLVTLRQTNHSAVISVVLTAIAFGLAHFPHRMGAVAIACIGAFSGMLFLWRGSLVPPFLFHFLGNLGVLYWDRRVYRLSR